MSARRWLLLVGAAGVLVSAYVHYYLYFHGGYRGISVDRVVGLDVSRSFALQAVTGFLLAWALVLSVRWDRFATWVALAGALFAAGSLVAFVLSRTSGLLGFTETDVTTEAVVAVLAEVVALASLTTVVVRDARRWRRPTPAASPGVAT